MSELWEEPLPGVWRVDVSHPVPGQTCCYLLAQNGEGALVDCGAKKGVDAVKNAVADAGLRPGQIRYIIPTHAHLDHAGAAGELAQYFSEAEVAAHPSTVKHLINPEERLLPAVRQLYGDVFFKSEYEGMAAVPANRARALADGDVLSLGGLELRILYTPGHAWNHISVYAPERKLIFTGDAFGVSYPGEESAGEIFIVPVTPPTQFNAEAMRATVAKIKNLGAAHAALAHFGVIENSPALADKQTAALDEWEKSAGEIAQKGGDYYAQINSYLEGWFKKQTGDGAALFRRHKGDIHLTVSGFVHWIKNGA